MSMSWMSAHQASRLDRNYQVLTRVSRCDLARDPAR
jgi:hypothetical protein